MNGPEHYREAERLLEQAAGQDQPAGGRLPFDKQGLMAGLGLQGSKIMRD